MYHKSFERERNLAGCSPRPDIIVLVRYAKPGWITAATPQPTTRGVVFHFRITTRCLFSPASSSIPNPRPPFPPSLHSFLSAVFYSFFCFRRARLTVYPQPHYLTQRCLSSLSLRLSSWSPLIRTPLSFASPIRYLSSLFTLRSIPRFLQAWRLSRARVSLILRDTDYPFLRSQLPGWYEAIVRRAVGPVRNSCLPCDRSRFGEKDFARWSGRRIYSWLW